MLSLVSTNLPFAQTAYRLVYSGYGDSGLHYCTDNSCDLSMHTDSSGLGSKHQTCKMHQIQRHCHDHGGSQLCHGHSYVLSSDALSLALESSIGEADSTHGRVPCRRLVGLLHIRLISKRILMNLTTVSASSPYIAFPNASPFP